MNKIIITLLTLIGCMLLYIIYEAISMLLKDRIIMVNKDNSISIYSKFLRGKSKIEIAGGTYPLDSRAIITTKGKMFWKKNYLFNENSTKPRILTYQKDNWLDAGSITKIINDEHIKTMSQKAIEPGTKIMIYLGAVSGFMAMIASGVLLAKELGLIA